MDRVILHCDANSFYASCEVARRPELCGLPVSVGGDPEARHGIILASTPQAKACGIQTGMALWQAPALPTTHHRAARLWVLHEHEQQIACDLHGL